MNHHFKPKGDRRVCQSGWHPSPFSQQNKRRRGAAIIAGMPAEIDRIRNGRTVDKRHTRLDPGE